MKQLILLISLSFISWSCSDPDPCPDFVESNRIIFENINQIHQDIFEIEFETSQGENFKTNAFYNFNFENEFDDNGCFVGGNESFEYEYKEQNTGNLFARVKIKAMGTNLNKDQVEITISSRSSNEDNTFNLFEFSIGPNIAYELTAGMTRYNNYQFQGNQYNQVIEFERSPILPGSDLNEIIRLIFSFEFGILAAYKEDGTSIERITQ